MRHIYCSHCGARNFKPLDKTKPNRCRDCGRPLTAKGERAFIRAPLELVHRKLTSPRGLRGWRTIPRK